MQEKTYLLKAKIDNAEIREIFDNWYDDDYVVTTPLFIIKNDNDYLVVDPETPSVYRFKTLDEIMLWTLEDEEGEEVETLKKALKNGKIHLYLVPFEEAFI